MKNTIYVVVIAVCLLLACVIAYKFIFNPSGSGSGIDSIPTGETTWVKCANKACGVESQMGLQEYYKAVKDAMKPNSMATPPLICNTCGEPSVYKAEKCQNPDCGIVFFSGVGGDFQDRCPECGMSATEEIRKARMAGK